MRNLFGMFRPFPKVYNPERLILEPQELPQELSEELPQFTDCTECNFYSNSPWLKCAVNPTKKVGDFCKNFEQK